MKILIKTAIVSAVLLGSGFTQAATTAANMLMGVDVPKSCTFSDVSSGLALPENGSEVQGTFTLSA